MLGGGIAVGVSGQADYDEWLATDDPARFDVLEARVADKQRAANGMFIAAAVLAATSVVLLFFEGRTSRPDRTALAPRIGRSSAALGVTF